MTLGETSLVLVRGVGGEGGVDVPISFKYSFACMVGRGVCVAIGLLSPFLCLF
jgi:hypothetical protein